MCTAFARSIRVTGQQSCAISSRRHSGVRDGRAAALKRATDEVPHAGDTVTRLREEPLEPGNDRPVFVMPLAAVVRNDPEDVLRELETAFQIPHCSVQACEGLPAV